MNSLDEGDDLYPLKAYMALRTVIDSILLPLAPISTTFNPIEIQLLGITPCLRFDLQTQDFIERILLSPGINISSFTIQNYIAAATSMQKKGIVHVETIQASSMARNVFGLEKSLSIKLTSKGFEIVGLMTANLNKSLNLLDDIDVRDSLSNFRFD